MITLKKNIHGIYADWQVLKKQNKDDTNEISRLENEH